jgi:microsomal dipeptidase-like Zn-dependent dipeptidase
MTRRKVAKIVGASLAVLVLAGLIGFFSFAADLVAGAFNPVLNKGPYTVSERARILQETLFIADLHADSLLWNYDLNRQREKNQVDVPRMIEGNLALQAFTVVTKTPRGLNIETNDDTTDSIFWLALAQRQPLENLSSLTKRALWQARRLDEYADRSAGKLVVIRNKQDLARFAERRKTEKVVGGWLGIEGAHALDGNVDNVDVLFDAGFRMMSPSHFFDNDMGGSAHGVKKYGLTEKGAQMVRRMQELGMLVDLAHASPATIDDVLALTGKPVVVSHTGVRGTCDNNRNLTDDQLKRIAATGGIVGIGFWDTAVCGGDAAAIAKAIRYTTDRIGVDHVALGSDLDGSITAPFDVSGMALLTEALLNEGFAADEIAKIMGGNTLRLLAECLPDAP